MTDAVTVPKPKIAALAHAEAKLRDSEARLRAILETAAEGIVTIDERGIIEQTNPEAERMFGYTSQEMVGRNVSMLMPRPYCHEHDRYLVSYLRTGQKKIMGAAREVEGLRKDGTVFPMDISIGEVHLGQGRIFSGILRDATERKRTESRVTGLGRILEESLNEIYIFDAETLRFIQVNRGARENLGYSMQELEQLTPTDLKTEYAPDAFAELIRLLRTGRRPKVAFTTVHRRKDGSLYDVEVHLQLCEYESKPAFAAIVLDITERRETIEALRSEHQFAQSLVETAQAVVLVLDPQGRIMQFNPFMEKLSGYRLNEVLGKNWFGALLPQEAQAPMREVFNRSLQGTPARGDVYPILTKNGTLREIAWWDETLKDADNNVVGVLAIGHDVTELREAQQKAVQAERLAAIGEMAAGLAHESRNALQRSQACLEMLEVELENRPEELDLVRRIQTAQDHLHRLYEEAREYAAPIKLDCEPCDVAHAWRDTWSHLRVARAGKDIELREEIENVDLRCVVDPFAIGQVFRNIMENSIAACPEPGFIEIRCSAQKSGQRPVLRISVRDNGPGLSAEQKQKLFDPFFTTKTKGTGLGMAIAWRIIQAHAGRIDVGEGPGAEIVLTLPREPE